MSTTGWQRPANYVKSSLRAVPGQLRVERDTLVFHPHRSEQALFARDWALQLDQIAGVEVAPRSFRHLLAGGVRRRLAIDTRDGRRELFVVKRVEQTVAALRELARPYS